MGVIDIFRKRKAPGDGAADAQGRSGETPKGREGVIDEVTAAAIAAAIFAMYEDRGCDVIIRSIERRVEPVSAWTYEGRRDTVRRL